MEFIINLLVSIIFDYLIGLPGATILWLFKKREGSIISFEADNRNISIIIGLGFWISLALMILLLS